MATQVPTQTEFDALAERVLTLEGQVTALTHQQAVLIQTVEEQGKRVAALLAFRTNAEGRLGEQTNAIVQLDGRTHILAQGIAEHSAKIRVLEAAPPAAPAAPPQ